VNIEILHYNVIVCGPAESANDQGENVPWCVACYVTPLDRSDAAIPDVFNNVTFTVRALGL